MEIKGFAPRQPELGYSAYFVIVTGLVGGGYGRIIPTCALRKTGVVRSERSAIARGNPFRVILSLR
jgi:hypothetical protein